MDGVGGIDIPTPYIFKVNMSEGDIDCDEEFEENLKKQQRGVCG